MKKIMKLIDSNDKEAIINQKGEEIHYLKAEVEYLKIESCSSGKKGSTIKEKVSVVYELQLKSPLKILHDISGVKKSTYSYTLSKTKMIRIMKS